MSEREKDTLERPGYTGELIRYVPTPALHLGGVVRDIPPIVQAVARVEARNPVELIYHWGRHGFPRYGVEDCVPKQLGASIATMRFCRMQLISCRRLSIGA